METLPRSSRRGGRRRLRSLPGGARTRPAWPSLGAFDVAINGQKMVTKYTQYSLYGTDYKG